MIFIINAAGQLCNRLVLLAHVYATGLETNQKVIHLVAKDLRSKICLSGNSLKIFGYDTRVVYNYYEKIMAKLHGADFRKLHKNKVENERYNLSKRGIHFVNNWYYRDYESLFKHREKIVAAFSPVESFANNVQVLVNNLKEAYPEYLLVGVHIRRGDYRHWKNGVFYFDDSMFCKWVTELKNSANKKMVFILFSNEEIDLDQFSKIGSPVVLGPGNPIEDLYVMAECDYIFGPPSTYSWWAAFFGGKKYLTVHSKNQEIHVDSFSYVTGEEFDAEKYLNA